MGWECRDIRFNVSLRLDSHGGDEERAHEALADELEGKLREALLAVLRDERYREILLFSPEYSAGVEEE